MRITAFLSNTLAILIVLSLHVAQADSLTPQDIVMNWESGKLEKWDNAEREGENVWEIPVSIDIWQEGTKLYSTFTEYRGGGDTRKNDSQRVKIDGEGFRTKFWGQSADFKYNVGQDGNLNP